MNNTVIRQAEKRTFWDRNNQSKGYLLKNILKQKAYIFFRALLMFGLCMLILQPILNKVSVTFMAEKDLYDTTVIAIPKNFTLHNLKQTAYLMNYWKTLVNTVWISFTVSLIQIIVCTLVGYGFARFEFPLKRFWFACIILLIIIPPQTISTSLYLHFRYFDLLGILGALLGKTINLKGSILPYYMMCLGCMGLKDGLYIYMIRQYFRTVPKELEEAAYVDGCGILATFYKIMLPDAKPIITSCFLFSFVWQWTDSFYTKLFLGDIAVLSRQLTSLAERLKKYLETVTTAYSQAAISTGVLLTIIPLLILYIFAQRGFVESLSQTGIKM
ncbi:carbohydrate ABC transporter permease [Anaerocolumna jejuensis]|uniref:carbohydrate ABC transporter permease n=1 Tax=Anaerocolumna jejuensis TaxID=259063 RepID=UPI003F7BFE07